MNDLNVEIEKIWKRLDVPHVVVLDLLEVYHNKQYAELWHHSPKLYQIFSRALIKQGHPAQAIRLAREGLHHFPEDTTLAFNVVLSFIRGGNITDAERWLNAPLQKALEPTEGMEPRLRRGIVALKGRILKDQGSRWNDPQQRQKYFAESAQWYEQAARLPFVDTYPHINAAIMNRLIGNIERSQQLAQQVLDLLQTPTSEQQGNYWIPATKGGASILLGQHDAAVGYYKEAIRLGLAANAIGDITAMRGDLDLLRQVGAIQHSDWIEEQIGSVIVFAGHMIDSPTRPSQNLPPRFPPDRGLETSVRQAIREELDRLNPWVGFCSLACGSDILFAEEMLARDGVELHVVLPFNREEFIEQSVTFGLVQDVRMQGWKNRFEAILARLPLSCLHYATAEAYLDTELLYDFTNTFYQGLAVIRADQFLVKPKALVVLDPQSERMRGGTRDFLENWQQNGNTANIIDLAKLRENTPGASQATGPIERTPLQGKVVPRSIKAMLFADVAKFSKLKEQLTPWFFDTYLSMLDGVVRSAGKHVLHVNTWGDGLYVVFDTVEQASRFALDFLERAPKEVPFPELGFVDVNPVRIGMHVGPVFELEDPFFARPSFVGQHVSRTARIEPVTLPGCAYASEQFAALLTMQCPGQFRCELVGIEDLAKEYDRCPLYRISPAWA